MSDKKRLNDEYAGLRTIKVLIETYQEIAAIRMQKVRTSVLANRAFLDELNGIYHQLRFSYDSQLIINKTRKNYFTGTDREQINTSLIKRNGKTIVVLLSSNTGLYGSIIKTTFNKFSHYIAQKPEVDIALVGRRGLSLFRSLYPNRKYVYHELEDHIVISKDVTEIIDRLILYEKVVVFHGRYESILEQTPVESNISGELPYKPKNLEDIKNASKISYLFEPSLEKILVFFETEIMASIFEQTVYESNLSKFAARMINLDASVVSISGKLDKVKFAKQQVKHREFNRRQLGALSGMALWGK